MKKLILIEPVWQTIWQWPAVVNLISGGTACGYYLINLIADTAAGTVEGLERTAAANLVAPLLVLIGFAAVGLEAGRPMAARYLLHHLRTSWMSREVLTGSFFILFSTLDALFPQPALKLPAALAAGGLLFSQAMMVNRCRAVAAWNHNLSLLHFLVSGIYLGFGLLLILYDPGQNILSPSILGIGILSSAANLVVWQRLVFIGRSASLRQAFEPQRNSVPLTITIGIAHLVPLAILLILVLSAVLKVDFKMLKGICAITGMAILLGASAQKYYIILKANLLRELSAGCCANRRTT